MNLNKMLIKSLLVSARHPDKNSHAQKGQASKKEELIGLLGQNTFKCLHDHNINDVPESICEISHAQHDRLHADRSLWLPVVILPGTDCCGWVPE